MKNDQRQAMCIEARNSAKRALGLLSRACLDLEGASFLTDAAAQLEQSAFNLRLVSDDLRREHTGLLKALPASESVLRAVRDLKAAGASDSEVFKRILEPYFAHLAEPPPPSPWNSSSGVVVSRNSQPVSLPKPVTNPAPVTNPEPSKRRRPRRVSRERGLRLFDELECEIRRNRESVR